MRHSEKGRTVGTASTFFFLGRSSAVTLSYKDRQPEARKSPHYSLFSRLCRTTRLIVRFEVGSSALRSGSCDKQDLLWKRFRDRSWQA